MFLPEHFSLNKLPRSKPRGIKSVHSVVSAKCRNFCVSASGSNKIIKFSVFMLSFCAMLYLLTDAKSAMPGSLTVSNINNELPILYIESDNIFTNEACVKEIPLKDCEQAVIPGGMTVGIRISTNGVLVLGTDYISDIKGEAHKPADGILYPGDLILSVNGNLTENKEALKEEINRSRGNIHLSVKRDGETLQEIIKPIKCTQTSINKIGAWVRDSTQGIGTITYINPQTMKFGALGHGIMDVDTKKLMSIKSGEVTSADVKSIRKGKRGAPGELVGDIMMGERFGEVRINNPYGLYGIVNKDISWLKNATMPAANKDDVMAGPATILTNIGSEEVVEYNIIVETLNKHSSDNSKGMIIRIIDERLINKTNGIVQGMSGSPILQNGRLIGAITHVFVQDPTKGYGIFIEHMLKQENSF